VEGVPCPPRCFPTVLGLALSSDGGTLYVGGSFAFVDGVPRNSAAAVTTGSGDLLPWNPDVFTGGAEPSLNVLYEVEYLYPRVYFCGDFYGINTPGRRITPNIVAVNTTTGAHDPSFVTSTDGAVNDCHVWSALNRLFYGGHFDYVGGPDAEVKPPPPTAVYRQHMAASALSTGAVDAWDPRVNSVAGVYAVDTDAAGTRVGIGGHFTLINFEAQQGFAQFPVLADTTQPSKPGKPSGVSDTSTTIDLTWQASSDPPNNNLTYLVFRDGVQVGTAESTATPPATVSFTDSGLAPSSSHVYRVQASDGTNLSLLSDQSDPITTQPAPVTIFSEAFDNGLQAWTSVTNLTIDTTQGGLAAPSARAQVSGAKAFARRALGSTFPTVCLSASVRLAPGSSGSVALLKLRTAANGPIGRVFSSPTGLLSIRSDVSGQQLATGVAMAIDAWNTVELCGTIGAAGAWNLYLNGSQIVDDWVTNNGTTPIGLIQIGDDTVKTFTMNIDDVIARTAAG
jgi:hypothetical protein